MATTGAAVSSTGKNAGNGKKEHTIYTEVEFEADEPLEELALDFDDPDEEDANQDADLDDYEKVPIDIDIRCTMI